MPNRWQCEEQRYQGKLTSYGLNRKVPAFGSRRLPNSNILRRLLFIVSDQKKGMVNVKIRTTAAMAPAASWRSPSTLAGSLEWVGTIATSPVALVLLWAMALAHFASILAALPGHARELDFSHYYVSAWALRQGHDPYSTNLAPIGRKLDLRLAFSNPKFAKLDHLGAITQGCYPPTFLLCFELLTLLRPATAYWVWDGITIAALAAALFLLLGPPSGLKAKTALAALALALIFWPLGVHFYWAQSQILILLLLIGMARLMKRRHAAWAGLSLAAAVRLRGFPIFIIGYLAVRRRWRELLYTASALAAGGLLTLVLVGVHSSFDFVRGVRYVTSPMWLETSDNVALASFILRLFRSFGGPPTLSVEIARQAVTWLARLMILGLTIQATVVSKPDQADDDWRGLSLWLAAMILLSPTAWTHYLVILLFPYAAMVASASHGRASSRAAAMIILSYVLTSARWVLIIIDHFHLGAHALFRQDDWLFFAVIGQCAFMSLLSAWLGCYWWTVDGAAVRTRKIEEPAEPFEAVFGLEAVTGPQR